MNFLFFLMGSRERTKLLKNPLRSSYESLQTSIQGTPVHSLGPHNTAPQLYEGTTEFNPVSRFFTVVEYHEPLFLQQALVIGNNAIWKFLVNEEEKVDANYVHIVIQTKEQGVLHAATVMVTHCESESVYKEMQLLQDIPNSPTWRVYRINSQKKETIEDKSYAQYFIVLMKPDSWHSSYNPVEIYFRGSYTNPEYAWEKLSSTAVVIGNSSSNCYEIGYSALILLKLGYSSNIVSQAVSTYNYSL